ncbi:MAG: 6-bladed beta-propeller [Elusimicrobiota bacterium]
MKTKLLIATLTVICALSITAWAAIGINLTSNGWNVTPAGGKGAGTWTSPTFSAQNIGTESGKLLIRASNTQNWSLSAAPGMNIFAMQFGDGGTWKALSTAESVLVQSLNAGLQYNFMLRYQSPSDLTDKTLSVTQISTVTISIISAALQQPVTSYVFLKKWGSRGSENGQLLDAVKLALDSAGNVYVADHLNNRVVKFTSNGDYIMSWGTAGSGDGQFSQASGIGIDSKDYIYVGDMQNNRVQVFTSSGQFVRKWGTAGTGNGQFDKPYGVDIDKDDNVYVTEYYGCRIQKFDAEGAYLMKFGTEGTGDGQLHHPATVAIDDLGYIYVADCGNSRVLKFDSNGVFVLKWGTFGLGNGQFDVPQDVIVDRSGNILVVDSRNYTGQNRVQIFTPNGVYISQFGNGLGTGDGQFLSLYGMVMDPSGKVYTLDGPTGRIQVFTPQ